MKPDAAAIRAFFESLPLQPWIAGTSRARWPLHLFRIDDVRASASILNSGVLYSRNRASTLRVLGHDAASREVMENSLDWIKDYVRLYFRPRTPTEFRSEGFRPTLAQQLHSHRPMPIVMVYDAVPIATAIGTLFTNGNAASRNVERGGTIDFLHNVPFEKVYHDGPLADSDKSEVVYRRCAEVLVRDELNLLHLKHILCRSQAGYETLFNLLTDDARRKFGRLIGVSAKVHYKRWSFAETVELGSERTVFRFNPFSLTPGPFQAVGTIWGSTDKVIGRWENKNFIAAAAYSFGLGKIGNPVGYRVTLELDGALAYCGSMKTKDSLL